MTLLSEDPKIYVFDHQKLDVDILSFQDSIEIQFSSQQPSSTGYNTNPLPSDKIWGPTMQECFSIHNSLYFTSLRKIHTILLSIWIYLPMCLGYLPLTHTLTMDAAISILGAYYIWLYIMKLKGFT